MKTRCTASSSSTLTEILQGGTDVKDFLEERGDGSSRFIMNCQAFRVGFRVKSVAFGTLFTPNSEEPGDKV